jgi:acetyl/propionyl-CoA carboxylase alpha subunit
MVEMTIKAAQAVGYINTSTFVFLITTLRDEEGFYFCENEYNIASWTPSGRNDYTPRCILNMNSCRDETSNIQNPFKDFLSAPGNSRHHQPLAEPNAGGTNVKVDKQYVSKIKIGKDIMMHYYSIISKVTNYGKDHE